MVSKDPVLSNKQKITVLSASGLPPTNSSLSLLPDYSSSSIIRTTSPSSLRVKFSVYNLALKTIDNWALICFSKCPSCSALYRWAQAQCWPLTPTSMWVLSLIKSRDKKKKKSRDVTLLTKMCIAKVMAFRVVILWIWALDHKEGWVPNNWCF